MTWADDADGDVFRRLVEGGFDFSRSYAVDFNVDFASWPPPQEAIDVLRSMYGEITVYAPDHDVSFKVEGKVSYEGVTSVQRRTTAAMAKFGGACESWGVLH